MHHGMARARRGIKLRDDVQSISATRRSRGQIAENRRVVLSRAGSVAAQANLVLIGRVLNSRYSIRRVNPPRTLLGRADGRGQKRCCR